MKLNTYKQKITEEKYKELKEQQFNSNLISNCVFGGLLVLWAILCTMVFSTDKMDLVTKILMITETLFTIIFIRLLQIILTKQRRLQLKEYETILDIQSKTKIQELAKMELAKENEEYNNFINQDNNKSAL